MSKLSVIIINYNTPEMTERAINQFRENEPELPVEIILIDNNSKTKLAPDTVMNLGVRYIENRENIGFARAVNQGIEISTGENILLLNSDVLVDKGAISKILDLISARPDIGVAGPKMIYPDGRAQVGCGYFPNIIRELIRLTTLYKIIPYSTLAKKTPMNRDLFEKGGEVDWLSGGCLLIRRGLVEKIGKFDGHYFFGIEDIDFCFRVKQSGFKIFYLPSAVVVHHHGLSSGGPRTIKKMEMERDNLVYFMKKNYPERIASRAVINIMHSLKILLLKIILNLKFKTKNSMAKYTPKDATIAITYKCNSRCQMCSIWQVQNPPELPVAWFSNLNPELKYINLTGGEPFLHQQLPAIVRTVSQASPKAQIIISSNGLATELICGTMEEILKIGARVGVRISLDGIGETHDHVRGIPGIFDHAIETIRRLQALGVKNLGFSFTIQDENKDDLLKVYDLSRQLKVQLAMALVQNSEIYFNKETNKVNAVDAVEKNLKEVIRRELSGPNPKHWLRAFYDYGLLLYLKEGKRLLPSGAGLDSLFIDPSGKIYPSNLINLEMGNLRDGLLINTWNNEVSNKIRKNIRENGISESWIICTIRGQMKRHAAKVIVWILKNKLKLIIQGKL